MGNLQLDSYISSSILEVSNLKMLCSGDKYQYLFKIKIFMWLANKNRILTNDNLMKKKMEGVCYLSIL